MSTDKRKRYDLDFDETASGSGSETRRRRPQSSESSDSGHSFDTSAVSRALEEQADDEARITRRKRAASADSYAGEYAGSAKRRTSSSKRRVSGPSEEAASRQALEERRYQERKKLRREAARWKRAHWIVRILIILVLAVDVILFRFVIFKDGFSPIWMLLSSRHNSTVTEQTTSTDASTDLQISEQLLTVNEYSRPGTALDAVNGIVIHYIGNPGTDAQENRDYFESLKDGTSDTYASCNYIVGLDGTIIQCVPDNEVAYASGDRNNDTISIQCCHPDESGAFTTETYESLVKLTAKLCKEYNLGTDQLLRHYDINNEKICPKFFVEDPDAWTNFLSSVQSCM